MRKILITVASGLLAYLVLAWLSGNLFGLTGAKLWILRIALSLIGVLAAGVLVWFFASKQKEKAAAEAGAEEAPTGGGELAVLIRDAEKKLAAANLEKGARIGNLPAILLLGEPSSTKTTIVLHSGLEPELLAGQVYQEGNVTSTRTANIWYSRRTLLVEAGGKLLDDAAARSYLLRRLQPRKLRAVVGQGGQAPRAALVCVEIERLTGGAQALATLARNLRARLVEIAELFGIQLPVYVLFTKTDRLPFFADFVRNLTKDESTQPLGSALPLAGPSAGVYGEEQAARLGGVFDRIFRALADARPELLSRENDATKLPGAYEFPREFRKLRGSLVQFLLDLCRPSQLSAGPFLRGFYFSAVRPVIIQEVAPVPEPRVQEKPAAAPGSQATAMFRVPSGGQAPAAIPQRRVAVSRKVPQWLFLTHFFNDVLLADRAAMGASGASARTDLWRRILLLAAAALCLVFAIGFTVSFFLNRGLESQVNQALQGATAPAPGAGLASLDSLTHLDALRQTLPLLRDAPLRYHWGLFVGDDLYPGARRLYFKRFHQLLFGQTQASLAAFLGGLPPAPGPNAPAYDDAYNPLKAYLMTTSNHEYSTPEFLSPLLLKTWSAGQTVDPDRLQLARKQFDFYAGELKLENPFSRQNDQGAVQKARDYLARFGDLERVYQTMKSQAPQTTINFNRQINGSRQYVVDNYDVAGPFTRDGWKFMNDAIRNPGRYVHGEKWVVGDQAAVNSDPRELFKPLLARYEADYTKEWRTYLRSASVVKYKDLKDASAKLSALADGSSPLLALFALAAQNIPWDDDPVIAKDLQPVSYLTPPKSERYIGPQNKDYINALIKLQSDLDAVASSPAGADSPAANQAMNDARDARNTTNQLAGFNFNPDPEKLALNLLLQPIANVEAKLHGAGADDLNAAGRDLCGKFHAVFSKYPFNLSGKQDAGVAEVNGLLHPPDGALWQFYNDSLKKLLPKQGNQYVPAQGTSVTLSARFVKFFQQAAAVSDFLYAGGSPDPHFSYSLKPVASDGIQRIGIEIDGQSLEWAGGAPVAKQFTWQASGSHGAKGAYTAEGATFSENSGIWAVFRLFGDADQNEPSPGGNEIFDWIIRTGKGGKPSMVNGKPLTVRLEVDMKGAPHLFEKDYFSRMGCVAEVAKP